jgi:hypothetical protein
MAEPKLHAQPPPLSKSGIWRSATPKFRDRDDDSTQILLGIRDSMKECSKKLTRDTWRHGCIAGFVKMPLENMYALDEKLLLGLGAFELTGLPML